MRCAFTRRRCQLCSVAFALATLASDAGNGALREHDGDLCHAWGLRGRRFHVPRDSFGVDFRRYKTGMSKPVRSIPAR